MFLKDHECGRVCKALQRDVDASGDTWGAEAENDIHAEVEDAEEDVEDEDAEEPEEDAAEEDEYQPL
jgi:hypothetical protein